jgi:hypothetical protein
LQIIRDFDVIKTNFAHMFNVEPVKVTYFHTEELRLIVGELAEFGELMLPVIHPRSVLNYFGFQVHEDTGVMVAALSPPRQYKHFSAGKWVNVDEPVFQYPEEIRVGMPFWTGAVQFHLLLNHRALYQTVSVGYEVPRDLLDYLIEFALPDYLSKPVVRTARQLYTDPLGAIYFPDGFDTSLVENIWVQYPLESMPMLGVLTDDRTVAVGTTLPPNEPLQLVFDLKLKVKRRNTTQIEFLPNVFVDDADMTNMRQLMYADSVAVDCGEKLFRYDESRRGFDLPVTVSITAASTNEANEIAFAIMDRIDEDSRLYAPAFDLEFGVQQSGILKNVGGNSLVGGLPTKRFNVVIKNISI